MSMLMRVGKVAWLALIALALFALPVHAAEKVINLEEPAQVKPEDEAKKAEAKKATKVKGEEVKAVEAAPVLTPEQAKAKALMDDLAKEEAWRLDRAKFLTENYTKSGIARFNELDYVTAKAEFEKALQQDPANKEAKEYLRKTEAILGLRQRPIIQDVTEQVNIEREIAMQHMKVGFNKAQEKLAKGEYDEAVAQFERVRELIRWISPYTNVEPYNTQTEDFIKRAETERAAKKALDKENERKQAEEVARMNEQYLRDRYEQRIARLLAKGRDLLAEARYEEAESIAMNVLEIDPMNSEAKKLREIAFDAGLSHQRAETSRNDEEQTLLTWATSKEAQVPYSDKLVYPKNWAEIIKRQVMPIGAETEQEAPWVPDLKAKLEQKVSFDFAETPLGDVVTFLQQITNATIILDQKALSGLPNQEVTLKVTEMKLSQALDWILNLVNLQYALKDNAIFISTPEAVGGDSQLKLYDVTDVTLEIRDFPGNLQALRDRIGTSSGSGTQTTMGDWDQGVDGGDEPAGTFTGETLVKFIQDTIAPNTWQGTEGP